MNILRRRYGWGLDSSLAVAFDPETVKRAKSTYKLIQGGNKELRDEDLIICAGTAFWIRFTALHVEKLALARPALEKQMSTGYVTNLGMEHVLERVLPSSVLAMGMKIGEIPPNPRLFAMYFPQYHPIPENDRFWGKNFTEWTLLRPANHSSLRKPLGVDYGGLGYYDLMEVDIRKKQAKLAKKAGMSGFVYYHYW